MRSGYESRLARLEGLPGGFGYVVVERSEDGPAALREYQGNAERVLVICDGVPQVGGRGHP